MTTVNANTRVTLALVGSIAFPLLGVIWWAAMIEARTADTEERVRTAFVARNIDADATRREFKELTRQVSTLQARVDLLIDFLGADKDVGPPRKYRRPQ